MPQIVDALILHGGIFAFTGSGSTDYIDTILKRGVIAAHGERDFGITGKSKFTAAVESSGRLHIAVESIFAVQVKVFGINSDIFIQSHTGKVYIITVGTVGNGHITVSNQIAGDGFAGNCITYIAFDNDFCGIGSFGIHSSRQAAEGVDADDVAVDDIIHLFSGVGGTDVDRFRGGIEDGKVVAALDEVVIVSELFDRTFSHPIGESISGFADGDVDLRSIKIAVSGNIDQRVDRFGQISSVNGDVDDRSFSEGNSSGGDGSVNGHVDNTFVDEFTVSLRIINIPFPRNDIQRTAIDIQRTAIFHPAVVSIDGDNAAFQNIGNAALMDLQQFLPRVGVEQIDITVNIRSAACNIEEAGVDRTAVFEGKFAAHTDNGGTAIENSTVFHHGSTVHIGLLDSESTFQSKVFESTDIAADVRFSDQSCVFKADISSGKSTDIDRAFTGDIESTFFDRELSTGGNTGSVDDGDVVNAIGKRGVPQFGRSGILGNTDGDRRSGGFAFGNERNRNFAGGTGSKTGDFDVSAVGNSSGSQFTAVNVDITGVVQSSSDIDQTAGGSVDDTAAVEFDIHLAAICIAIVISGGKSTVIGDVQRSFAAFVTDDKGIIRDFVTGAGSGAFDGDRSIVNIQSTFFSFTEDDHAVGGTAEGDFRAVFNGHFGVVILFITDLDFAGKFGIVDNELSHDVHGVDLVIAGGVGNGKSTIAAETDVSGLEDLVGNSFAGDITEDNVAVADIAVMTADDHLTADIDVGVSSEINTAVKFIIVISPSADISESCIEIAGVAVFALEVDRTFVDAGISKISIVNEDRSGQSSDIQ